MLRRIRTDEFHFANEDMSNDTLITLDSIEFYYGNFSQINDELRIKDSIYQVLHREIVKIAGSVRDPLHTLLKHYMNERTVRKIQSFYPDAILCEFLGTEPLVDYDQPNPEGMFVLKFEMAYLTLIAESAAA